MIQVKANKLKKFTIKKILDQLPRNERVILFKSLPGYLNISSSRWRRILYAPVDSKTDLYGTELIGLATIFNISPELLYANPPKSLPFLTSNINTNMQDKILYFNRPKV